MRHVAEITHEADPDDPQARVLRFAGYAAAAVGRSNERVAAAMQGLPPMGEPVKYGHHSAKRHLRALERSDQNMRAAVEEGRKAEYWKDRAQGTERRARQQSDPDVVRRRIAELEKRRRQQDRTLAREGLSEAGRNWATRWHEHLTLRIAFEEGRLADLAPAPFAPLTSYKKGDVVAHQRWGKCQVLNVGRVNLKLAQLEGATKGWTWSAPPYEVQPWLPSGSDYPQPSLPPVDKS
nr:DUF3560 domain-containing protein [Deinococcus betulae]